MGVPYCGTGIRRCGPGGLLSQERNLQLDQARRERNQILNTLLVVLVASIGAYIFWTYVAVHYWGIAAGLPWAQYDESWALPVAAAVLTAAVILYHVLLRRPRKRTSSLDAGRGPSA